MGSWRGTGIGVLLLGSEEGRSGGHVGIRSLLSRVIAAWLGVC